MHYVPYDLFADPKAQDQYFSAAVLCTEAMLDDMYKGLKEKHGRYIER